MEKKRRKNVRVAVNVVLCALPSVLTVSAVILCRERERATAVDVDVASRAREIYNFVH